MDKKSRLQWTLSCLRYAFLLVTIVVWWSVLLMRSFTTGLGQDFTTMYVAALAWLHGSNPYMSDLPARLAAQLGIKQQGVINTPLVVLSDAPLTLLPPHSAYIVFVLIQYGLAAFAAFILAKTFELKNTRLIITAVVASPALFLVGFFGQIGAYVFLAFVIALWADKKNYAMLAGVAIACTLIKPQLGICIAVALLWGAPWRTWLGFGLTGLALLGVTVIMLSPSGAIAYVHALQMFQHSNFATHSPDSLGLTSLYYGWASPAMSIFLKISLGIIMVVALVLLAIRYKYRPTSQARAAVIYILVLVTSYSHQYDTIALLPCLWMARLPHGKVMNAVAVIGRYIQIFSPLMAVSSVVFYFRLFPVGILCSLVPILASSVWKERRRQLT